MLLLTVVATNALLIESWAGVKALFELSGLPIWKVDVFLRIVSSRFERQTG